MFIFREQLQGAILRFCLGIFRVPFDHQIGEFKDCIKDQDLFQSEFVSSFSFPIVIFLGFVSRSCCLR